MDLFSTADKKYLSFIHNRSDTLSQYFVNWISSSETVSSQEETKLLLTALKKIQMITLPDATVILDRDEVIRSTHSYIQASATRTVNLYELSKNIFGNENYLPDYIYQFFPTIPTEFKAHNPTLRQFVKVYAKADNIELNFYPSAYREGKIKFDSKDSSQIIIRSQDLADQIRNSLNDE